MAWKDRRRKASFRGIEFEVPDDTLETGRRIALHEFPQKDKPYAEDLGRKARKFEVECYVIGPDFDVTAKRLIEAFEEKGPGLLVHPFYGEHKVAVESARPKYSTREGGMARFSVTFVEAGENKYPTQIADTRAQVSRGAVVARQRAAERFLRRFRLTSVPEFVRTSSQATFTDVLGQLEAQARVLTGGAGDASAMLRNVANLRTTLPAQLADPFGLASSFQGLLTAFKDLAPDRKRQAYGGYLALSAATPATPIVATTATRLVEAENTRAIEALTQHSALVEAAALSAEIDFDSRQDALATRADLAARLETAAADASDDEFRALTDLRVAVVKDIGARAAGVPSLVAYSPARTEPALVIANRLYGDAAFEGEIVGRNRIAHPAFVPGGRPLELPAYG